MSVRCRNGRPNRGRVCERPQREAAVNRAQIPNASDLDASVYELARVSLAFVAEHIAFARHNESGRESAKLLYRRMER